MADNELKQKIKALMMENLMLQTPIDSIPDDGPLFGPDSIGLDSVDALQLVVMLDKNFGLKISDPEKARSILQSINTMTEAVEAHQTSAA